MQVSAVMGVYNAENERFFCKSIASILKQSGENFELVEFIICDDGSTDNTYSMLVNQAASDSRIILLKNEKNMGLGYTLNRCIAASKGELLVRQDIDDYSAENRIAELVGELEKNPQLAFVGSAVMLCDDRGACAKRSYPQRPQGEDFLFSVPFMHGAVAMRKSAIIASGGYDTSKRSVRCEDYELFMNMHSKGFFGGNIDKPLYFYKEDLDSQRRRKYRFRFNEAVVRYRGFRRLGLMPAGILYIIKPLVVGLIPRSMLLRLKTLRYKMK